MVELRPYQEQLLESIRASIRRGHRSVLAVMPTGSGKGTTIASMVAASAQRGHRVLILAHRAELVSDLSQRIHSFGISHGVIAAGYREDLRLPVQVGSVQTVTRRLARIPAPSMIIQDEAHHLVAGNMWGRIIEAWPAALLIGKTATPERLDGKGLGNAAGGFFTDMVQGPDASWLQANGYLAPARYFIPPGLGIDWNGLKHRGGDIDERDAARAIMAHAQAVAGPVTQYQAHLNGQTAIAFCCTVEHAQLVARGFNDAGIPAAVLDGTLDRLTRRRRIEALGTGEIKVLTSCQVISEGTDVPSVGGCLLLRPTDSLSLYLQQVGRCLRPSPGKAHATILDMVGNCAKHGFHTDPRDWSLEGRKKRKASSAAPIRECPGCYAALPAATAVCPECGHIFTTETQDHGAEQLGTALLVEVTEAEKQRIATEKRREVGKARSLAELEAIAAQRGYKPGWARYVWQSRQQRAFG
jgi:superfamily II DNA or RNA helicase